MRRPAGLLVVALLLALSGPVAAQATATVRKHSLLHTDSAVISPVIDTLEPGTKVTLHSTDHPNGYYNLEAPGGKDAWVYMRHVELDPGSSTPSDPVVFGPGVEGTPGTVGCGDGLWHHVYNPERLLVKAQCVKVTGILKNASASWQQPNRDGTRREGDGDTHGWLRPDSQYRFLLDSANMVHEDSNLVFEIICRFHVTQVDAKQPCTGYQDSVRLPKVGSHVAIRGAFVQDNHHSQWNEIHPVSKIDSLP